MSADLASIINMGALAVNQLLSSSQDRGVELTLETAPLENQVRLFLCSYINIFILNMSSFELFIAVPYRRY